MSKILIDLNKERNKADQRRQEAKSLKVITQSATSIDTKKFEASKQNNAPINAEILVLAKQEATLTNQKTTTLVEQRATSISQKTTLLVKQKATLINQKTTVLVRQRGTSIRQKTIALARQKVAPIDSKQENSLLLKKKNDVESMQKRVAKQFNRIEKKEKRFLATRRSYKLQIVCSIVIRSISRKFLTLYLLQKRSKLKKRLLEYFFKSILTNC